MHTLMFFGLGAFLLFLISSIHPFHLLFLSQSIILWPSCWWLPLCTQSTQVLLEHFFFLANLLFSTFQLLGYSVFYQLPFSSLFFVFFHCFSTFQFSASLPSLGHSSWFLNATKNVISSSPGYYSYLFIVLLNHSEPLW